MATDIVRQTLLAAVILSAVLLVNSFSVPKRKNVYAPAEPCDATACQLPNCKCATQEAPIDVATMPQLVMLSFDDAITTNLYYSYYQGLFYYTNPNGCKIGMTFFLSHDYTDYTLVNDVYKRGYEIASHSISHRTPTDYWKTLDYQGWIDEMYGLKQIAVQFGNISADSVTGTRIPFLQGNGDTEIQALVDSSFLYDCTLPTQQYEYPPLYPYSFDYKSNQDCPIPPCPQDSYPGFWEVPLVDYNDTQNIPCAMLDACPITNTTEDTYNFLYYNFLNHYQSNKAPYGLFTHAAWFQSDPSHYPGYLQFIDTINAMPDVYIVTVGQALQWVKNPTSLSDIANFAPFKCDNLPTPGCSPKTNCYYPSTDAGGSRYMNVCGTCPPNYPWVGNPTGE